MMVRGVAPAFALAAVSTAVMAQTNKPLLDRAHHYRGVGGYGRTEREYAEIASIPPRFYLLARMIMELSK